MIKFVMAKLYAPLWDLLTHPKAFAFWFMFACSVPVMVMSVDIPFKGATAPELWIANEVEQYQLIQANIDELEEAERWDEDKYNLEERIRTLAYECHELEMLAGKFQSNIYELMASSMRPEEKGVMVRRAEASLRNTQKKFDIAKAEKLATTRSLRELVATR